MHARFAAGVLRVGIAAAVLLLLSSPAPTAAAGAPGTWTPTGTMVLATCSGHTATLLTNGKVLVVDNVFAQLYDPATGSWSHTGELLTGRNDYTATLLS